MLQFSVGTSQLGAGYGTRLIIFGISEQKSLHTNGSVVWLRIFHGFKMAECGVGVNRWGDGRGSQMGMWWYNRHG